jgi:predicted dehydrogenase
MINIAIIGYGYWGPNLVRNFSTVSQCKVHTVVDARDERLALVARNYPQVQLYKQVDEVFNNPEIDAVVIATPIFTHFELAKKALLNGKHVLVEKPLTSNTTEAQELIDLSLKMGKLLMVDHTFLYTGAVQKIKSLIDDNTLGKLQYFDSTRINLGLIQPDVNVLWDLAPHDLSILFYLFNEVPVSIQALGISHTKNDIENIAYLTVNYQSNFIAHFNCSWSAPVKLRNILIGGDKKMVLFDDIQMSEKVKVYDTGFEVKNDEDKRKLLVNYRTGDVHSPQIENAEALHKMATDFIQSILNNSTPISNYEMGLNVVKVLSAAQESIKNKGKEVLI